MTKVYLVAATRMTAGSNDFIQDLGHKDWVEDNTHHADLLVEMAGRLCYRSWAPYKEGDTELNANVERVRLGNEKYLGNILGSGHGSVLEHVNFTFILKGVSRVLTHELVRHRAGMAYSQESLRYCRLEHLELIIPPIEADPDTQLDAGELFKRAADFIRETIIELNALLLKDAPDFDTKKKMTSLIRRIAPIGLSTSIMFTANARALRHLIHMRTHPAAEVEIQEVFREIAIKAIQEAPHIFQDIKNVDGHVTFENPKV